MLDIKLLFKHDKEVKYIPPFSSVYNLLKNHADKQPQKEAVISVDVDLNTRDSITYKELLNLTLRTAGLLQKHGIKRDDRLGILMPNSLEVLLFELAAGLIGATTVPLDHKRDSLERKLYKIRNTITKIVFIKENSISLETKLLTRDVPTVSFSDFKQFLTLLPNQVSKLPISDNLDSLYLILYTSGTTALPKGVPLTSLSLIANADGIAKWQHLTSKDKFNIILPLHHINSTTMSLATLLAGGTVVLNSRYSASQFWQVVAKEQCTITSVVPTVLHDLLVRHEEFVQNKLDVSSLKRILIGSAPVLPEETLKFYHTFHIRPVQGYGQTETALRVTGTPIDLSKSEYIDAVKTNTIGVELANCNVTILKKNGVEAQENKAGEICIRGPVIAEGYWQDSQETKKSFYNGWFHSGDLGYYKIKNNTRFFYIVGRLKEIIIKGGVNLSPALIEDALLYNFPEISEVSVVGYPDIRMGEEVAAVIVPKIQVSHNKLVQKILVSAKNNEIAGLSHYEVPQKVIIVDHLPKTSTGKIQRVEVKKMLINQMKSNIEPQLYVRQIKVNEKNALKLATIINNERWFGLPATLKEFSTRAINGLLFGVFDENNNLFGSLSCVQLPFKKVHDLKTWKETTGGGTLKNHDPKGDTLLCVAISVKRNSSSSQGVPSGTSESKNFQRSSRLTNARSNSKLMKIAKQKIEEYVKSGKDHVLAFHEKPKGGLSGAKVWKILKNGRPQDLDAMGYNVLMKYPDVNINKKVIYTQSSPSIMLIEHALIYAQKHGLKHVIAFSRPSGFRSFLSHPK